MQDRYSRSQIAPPVSTTVACKKGSTLSNSGKLVKKIWEPPALLVSHETLTGANNLTSVCGKDVCAEKQQSCCYGRRSSSGLFLPQIHNWFWKGKEGCSVFEVFSEVFCSGLILLPLISAGEESSCCWGFLEVPPAILLGYPAPLPCKGYHLGVWT